MSTVSVIIPVYKNVDEFVQNLIHNNTYLGGCEIIIVNDDPSTCFPKDLQVAKSLSDSITWINNVENTGFSPSVNKGASVAHGELLFLLNSDVVILDDSWKLVPPYFDGETSLFAIGLAQQEKDGRIVGRNKLYFKGGLFHHRALAISSRQSTLLRPPSSGLWQGKAVDSHVDSAPNTLDSIPQAQNSPDLALSTHVSLEAHRAKWEHSALVSTAWAEGGASLFRKRMWDDLGGMDEAYAPFYWEDVDLSYRAHKRGWKSMFAPFVIVKHEHESTIGTHFAQSRIPVAFRNQLRFARTHAKGLQRLEFYVFLLKTQLKKLLGRKTLLTKAQP